MATFRKHGGAWQAQIIRRGYPSLYRTFDTKAQAEAWVRQIESEIDRRVFVDRCNQNPPCWLNSSIATHRL